MVLSSYSVQIFEVQCQLVIIRLRRFAECITESETSMVTVLSYSSKIKINIEVLVLEVEPVEVEDEDFTFTVSHMSCAAQPAAGCVSDV